MGDHLGPRFCFRGLDNPAYGRLDPGNPRFYEDTTGCGNSLNARDPLTLQLIMDSLRYWITEMHVDGYRFDLAPTLARQEGEFGTRSASCPAARLCRLAPRRQPRLDHQASDDDQDHPEHGLRPGVSDAFLDLRAEEVREGVGAITAIRGTAAPPGN